MVFSSLVFLFVFLPIVLAGYYLLPVKFRNHFLFFSSFIFFTWGGASYSFILLLSIAMNYFIGKGISNTNNSKFYLILGLSLNLLILVIFKYIGFIAQSLNVLTQPFGIVALPIPDILLPIGISFYTFQSLSYLVDVYRQETKVQNSFINLGLYISLFPQLIAGPIVRYHDISDQITQRIFSSQKFVSGILRFTLGLGKKVLIANNMAVIADHVFELQPDMLSLPTAWFGVIAYSIQIYFDFSGYSDMAIGLGRMFGFELLENFNYPYMAQSIRDFWRRWHISLSNWFRDYLYIPLGGNRSGHTYLNLFFVFFVTGLWHGASWNFVGWGLIHGTLMVIERLGFGKVLNRLPNLLQNLYVLFFVMISWVLFRAEDFQHTAIYINSLFDFSSLTIKDVNLFFTLSSESIVVLIIAVLGSSGFFKWLLSAIKHLINIKIEENHFIQRIFFLAQLFFIVIILLLCTTYLVSNSYNPFIYFRF